MTPASRRPPTRSRTWSSSTAGRPCRSRPMTAPRWAAGCSWTSPARTPVQPRRPRRQPTATPQRSATPTPRPTASPIPMTTDMDGLAGDWTTGPTPVTISFAGGEYTGRQSSSHAYRRLWLRPAVEVGARDIHWFRWLVFRPQRNVEHPRLYAGRLDTHGSQARGQSACRRPRDGRAAGLHSRRCRRRPVPCLGADLVESQPRPDHPAAECRHRSWLRPLHSVPWCALRQHSRGQLRGSHRLGPIRAPTTDRSVPAAATRRDSHRWPGRPTDQGHRRMAIPGSTCDRAAGRSAPGLLPRSDIWYHRRIGGDIHWRSRRSALDDVHLRPAQVDGVQGEPKKHCIDSWRRRLRCRCTRLGPVRQSVARPP